MSTLDELFGLHGQVAVVTGSSGGLGVEFADALAGAGANVALLARRREQLEEVAARLTAAHNVRVLPIAVDITQAEALGRAFERIETDLGRIDIVVNSAAIAPTGRAEKQWPQDWRQTIDLNLDALFHCCLLAAATMRERGYGRIINVASIFGHLGSSLFRVAAYAASKGGVENLTRQLAVEWAADGITVNAIAPAWFASDMTAGSLDRQTIVDRMGGGAMLKRMGRPGELKTACLFLAAPASSYVTGSVIHVDGGYSAW